MARAAFALVASLAALSASAQTSPAGPPGEPLPSPRAIEARPAPAPPSDKAPVGVEKPTLPRGAVLEEVAGTVRDIDRKAYKLEVDTPTGPVTLSLDRNTMVYTAGGLATVLDVKPGTQIRAGRNADFLAYWVQVRTPAKQEPSSTPGQGTGPAGGAGAPVPEGGPGAPAPSTGAAPGGPR
jgi:translation initiation factor IF-2